ncbi:hypothetical protein ACFYE1_15990 [Kocuria sp. CPCC 205315]
MVTHPRGATSVEADVRQVEDRVRIRTTHDILGPAREIVWNELQEAGVDHINTDDLPGLQEHLTC